MRALTAAVIACEIIGAMAALVGVLWIVAAMVWLELADIAAGVSEQGTEAL